MNLILFDDERHDALKPLTYTRPVADLRVGILRIAEKWEKRLDTAASYLTMPYLSGKFPVNVADENVLVNGALLPGDALTDAVSALELHQKLVGPRGEVLALVLPGAQLSDIPPNRYRRFIDEVSRNMEAVSFDGQIDALERCTDIFVKNGGELERDFDLLTKGRTSVDLPGENTIIGNRFFAEEGATALAATFNTTTGPVYLGAGSTVMEGSLVRGGFALCASATLKMGAKIYGPTTVGPHSKVGGEVNNCVIQGFSNKGHDGFLGNSVIGQWCNLGADTNTSNLKNNYGEVKTWDYTTASINSSGRQFVGLIMGDHSKCGINTMFNTGTTVGVFANVFGAGFPAKFIPSFSWGGPGGFETYDLEKAYAAAQRVMSRRDVPLTDSDRDILSTVFANSAKFRF